VPAFAELLQEDSSLEAADVEIVIGRSADCDLVVDDPYVSGRARIERRHNGYQLVDLGSTNGSLIDGQRVSRRLLGFR
jgi:pSer/pThr/pTyr-binding forkhead associated (FHA) protein